MEFTIKLPSFKSNRLQQLESEVKELRATLNNSWQMKDIVFGSNSTTITKQNALALSAVYSALNILGDTMNIPVSVYKRLPGGDKQQVTEADAYEYQVYKLLHISPNSVHTPSEYFKLMEVTRNIYGNAYNYIVRDRLGMPLALKWVHPQNVDVRFDGVRLHYDFRDDSGNTVLSNVPHWDVIHLKALSRDGAMGISPIDAAKDSLHFGKSLQDQGNKYFDEGMMNKVVAVHPQRIGTQGEKNLKESIDKKLKGSGSVLLEEGIKLYPLSITNEQSQFLQSREFSVTEVARWFNIPEFMLANNDPTYSNIENFSLHFITHNVRPRVRMYEQEFNWKLLGNFPDFYTEFNMDALVRADIKSQAEYFRTALAGVPWMKPNEVRELKNLNKDDEGYGDKFYPPLNAANTQQEVTQDE